MLTSGVFASAATRTITAVDLHATDVDFGFRRPASIGDRVWNDLDGDGVQDGGEPGLVGWQVNITGPMGYANSHFTGANGIYTFTDANSHRNAGVHAYTHRHANCASHNWGSGLVG